MAAAVVIVHTAAVVEEEEEEAGMPADLAGMPAAEVVSGGAAGQGEPDTTWKNIFVMIWAPSYWLSYSALWCMAMRDRDGDLSI